MISLRGWSGGKWKHEVSGGASNFSWKYIVFPVCTCCIAAPHGVPCTDLCYRFSLHTFSANVRLPPPTLLLTLTPLLPYSSFSHTNPPRSPGGLGTGAYAGHSFWDLETWMAPVLTVLHPDLAVAAAQYRFDRVAAR